MRQEKRSDAFEFGKYAAESVKSGDGGRKKSVGVETARGAVLGALGTSLLTDIARAGSNSVTLSNKSIKDAIKAEGGMANLNKTLRYHPRSTVALERLLDRFGVDGMGALARNAERQELIGKAKLPLLALGAVTGGMIGRRKAKKDQ